jgi:hypothetical protein
MTRPVPTVIGISRCAEFESVESLLESSLESSPESESEFEFEPEPLVLEVDVSVLDSSDESVVGEELSLSSTSSALYFAAVSV